MNNATTSATIASANQRTLRRNIRHFCAIEGHLPAKSSTKLTTKNYFVDILPNFSRGVNSEMMASLRKTAEGLRSAEKATDSPLPGLYSQLKKLSATALNLESNLTSLNEVNSILNQIYHDYINQPQEKLSHEQKVLLYCAFYHTAVAIRHEFSTFWRNKPNPQLSAALRKAFATPQEEVSQRLELLKKSSQDIEQQIDNSIKPDFFKNGNAERLVRATTNQHLHNLNELKDNFLKHKQRLIGYFQQALVQSANYTAPFIAKQVADLSSRLNNLQAYATTKVQLTNAQEHNPQQLDALSQEINALNGLFAKFNLSSPEIIITQPDQKTGQWASEERKQTIITKQQQLAKQLARLEQFDYAAASDYANQAARFLTDPQQLEPSQFKQQLDNFRSELSQFAQNLAEHSWTDLAQAGLKLDGFRQQLNRLLAPYNLNCKSSNIRQQLKLLDKQVVSMSQLNIKQLAPAWSEERRATLIRAINAYTKLSEQISEHVESISGKDAATELLLNKLTQLKTDLTRAWQGIYASLTLPTQLDTSIENEPTSAVVAEQARTIHAALMGKLNQRIENRWQIAKLSGEINQLQKVSDLMAEKAPQMQRQAGLGLAKNADEAQLQQLKQDLQDEIKGKFSQLSLAAAENICQQLQQNGLNCHGEFAGLFKQLKTLANSYQQVQQTMANLAKSSADLTITITPVPVTATLPSQAFKKFVECKNKLGEAQAELKCTLANIDKQQLSLDQLASQIKQFHNELAKYKKCLIEINIFINDKNLMAALNLNPDSICAISAQQIAGSYTQEWKYHDVVTEVYGKMLELHNNHQASSAKAQGLRANLATVSQQLKHEITAQQQTLKDLSIALKKALTNDLQPLLAKLERLIAVLKSCEGLFSKLTKSYNQEAANFVNLLQQINFQLESNQEFNYTELRELADQVMQQIAVQFKNAVGDLDNSPEQDLLKLSSFLSQMAEGAKSEIMTTIERYEQNIKSIDGLNFDNNAEFVANFKSLSLLAQKSQSAEQMLGQLGQLQERYNKYQMAKTYYDNLEALNNQLQQQQADFEAGGLAGAIPVLKDYVNEAQRIQQGIDNCQRYLNDTENKFQLAALNLSANELKLCTNSRELSLGITANTYQKISVQSSKLAGLVNSSLKSGLSYSNLKQLPPLNGVRDKDEQLLNANKLLTSLEEAVCQGCEKIGIDSHEMYHKQKDESRLADMTIIQFLKRIIDVKIYSAKIAKKISTTPIAINNFVLANLETLPNNSQNQLTTQEERVHQGYTSILEKARAKKGPKPLVIVQNRNYQEQIFSYLAEFLDLPLLTHHEIMQLFKSNEPKLAESIRQNLPEQLNLLLAMHSWSRLLTQLMAVKENQSLITLPLDQADDKSENQPPKSLEELTAAVWSESRKLFNLILIYRYKYRTLNLNHLQKNTTTSLISCLRNTTYKDHFLSQITGVKGRSGVTSVALVVTALIGQDRDIIGLNDANRLYDIKSQIFKSLLQPALENGPEPEEQHESAFMLQNSIQSFGLLLNPFASMYREQAHLGTSVAKVLLAPQTS